MSDSQEPGPVQALTKALNHLHDRVAEPTQMGEQAAPLGDEGRRTYFGFAMAECHWLVAADVFCELIVEPDVAPLPNAPPLFLGLYNRRGDMLPVFQLHGLTGASAPSLPRVLLLGRGPEALGLLVDTVPVSLELDDAEFHQPSDQAPGALHCLCQGHHRHEDINWLCLNSHELGKQLVNLSWETDKATA